ITPRETCTKSRSSLSPNICYDGVTCKLPWGKDRSTILWVRQAIGRPGAQITYSGWLDLPGAQDCTHGWPSWPTSPTPLLGGDPSRAYNASRAGEQAGGWRATRTTWRVRATRTRAGRA